LRGERSRGPTWPDWGVASNPEGKGCRRTYQEGGEEGEEQAEAEDDAVAGGFGEDRHAAEEAAR